MTLLAVDRLEARHGLLQAVRGVSLQRRARARRSRSSARTAPARRRCCARSPARTGRPAGRVAFDGEDITRRAAHAARRAGHRARARGTAAVRAADGRGEPAARARRRPARARGRVDAVLEAFPNLRAAPPAAAGTSVGRRAAGDGDRPRADDATRSCCCSTRSRSGLSPLVVDRVYDSLAGADRAPARRSLLVEQDLKRALAVAEPRHLHARGPDRARRADARR